MACPRYDAVLFDLDGTLIDTYQLILRSMRHATKAVLGTDLSDAELMARVGTPLEDQMLILAGNDAELGTELTRVYREHNERTHDERIERFDGVREMLERLKSAGVPMAVVTSKKHALALRGIHACGLDGYLDFVIGPDDFPAHKPDPGPVLEGCKRLGVAPEHSLYVGDSPYDMRAGNGAGCDTAAVAWGVFLVDMLKGEHPDFVVASPADLVALVLGA